MSTNNYFKVRNFERKIVKFEKSSKNFKILVITTITAFALVQKSSKPDEF